MFTVCPKCQLTLVVTAADLKVAQGYVRCGRCSNVFNALEALSDEKQALEFDAAATKAEDVFVEPQIGDEEPTGTYETIVLESGGEDPAPPDEELEQELQSLAQRIEAQTQERPQLLDTRTPPSDPDIEEVVLEEERAPRNLWPWRLGAAALILLLAMQVMNHFRHELAVYRQLRVPLTRIYHALGVSLVPRWNVAAYEVRQLGAATSSANQNQLIVRASIKNAAPRAQPLPLLRVAMQDRYGNRIATRDVAAQSYAPRSGKMLGSGQRIDVEMRFVDPGSAALGFEIDACIAAPGGGVNCANR